MKREERMSKANRLSLTLGVLASGVLAGIGGVEVFAGEDLEAKVEPVEDVQKRAEERIHSVLESKENSLGINGQEGSGIGISEELELRVNELLEKEVEIDEEDTGTLNGLKKELISVKGLIVDRHQRVNNLVRLVDSIRQDNPTSERANTGGMTLSEGEEKINTLEEEISVLLDIHTMVEEEVMEAEDIQDEIAQVEADLLDRIRELLGRGAVSLSSNGEIDISNGVVQYLDNVSSQEGSVSVSSSVIEQTTAESEVLASYYGSNDDLDDLIAEGMQYVGGRYVWGGTSLSNGGFDCSGLMVRMFDDALGIKLPRVARDQQNFGTRVDLADIQPGDLVFWNTPATHVGLYLGNGKVLEAANKQAGIRVRDVRLSELSSATRVTDFGIKDKGVVVHITNAKKSVSYNPVLNEEQSNQYNANAEREAERNRKEREERRQKELEEQRKQAQKDEQKAKEEAQKEQDKKEDNKKEDNKKEDNKKEDNKKEDNKKEDQVEETPEQKPETEKPEREEPEKVEPEEDKTGEVEKPEQETPEVIEPEEEPKEELPKEEVVEEVVEEVELELEVNSEVEE